MALKGRKKTAERIQLPEKIDKIAPYSYAALADRLDLASAQITSLRSMDKAVVEIYSGRFKPGFIIQRTGNATSVAADVHSI